MTGKVYIVEKLRQNGDSFNPESFVKPGRKGFYPVTHSIKKARKLETMEKARRFGSKIVNPIRIRPATVSFA